MRISLTGREKVLTLVAATGLLIFLLLSFGLLPLLRDWQDTSAQMDLLQTSYIRKLKMAREAQSFEKKLNRAGTGQSGSALVAEFLAEIETVAGDHILIRRFQPLQTPLDRTSAAPRNTSARNIEKLRIQIECSGSLNNLMAFIQNIEKKDAFTRIQHLYLTPEGNGSESLQCQVILMRMILT